MKMFELHLRFKLLTSYFAFFTVITLYNVNLNKIKKIKVFVLF